MPSLKVIMIEPIGGHGGNEFYDFGICQSAAENGVDMTLYTCDETSLNSSFKPSFTLKKYYKGIYKGKIKFIRGLKFFFATVKVFLEAKKNRVGIVHLHLYHFSALEYIHIVFFRLFGFKIVCTIHELESFAKFGQKSNFKHHNKFTKKIDTIIVHSLFAKKELEKIITNHTHSRICILPNLDIDFVYKDYTSQKEAREKLYLPAEGRIILFFGQIKKVKGLDVLIKAFSLISSQLDNIFLVIAGKTWKVDFAEYKELIDTYNIGDKTLTRIKYIANKEVKLYFSSADLVVLPYRKIYSSGILIRALYYNSAVVASDLELFKTYIEDGLNGLLFRNGDYHDLGEKLIGLIKDNNKIRHLKQNAKNSIEQKYSLPDLGKKYFKIYKTLNRAQDAGTQRL